MIWVIGRSGLLGSTFVSYLKGTNLSFTATGREVDISNIDLLNSNFNEIKPDLIINCSGFTDVEAAETNQYLAEQLNFTGVSNLSKVAFEKKIQLIHFSTDYVFDGKKKTPYNEKDTPSPLSIYGKTKLRGEEVLLKTSPDNLLIRVSWLYNHTGKGFINRVIEILLNKPAIQMVNDQTSSPTCAENLVHAIINLYQKATLPTGIFHYQDSGFASRYEITCFLAETLAKKHPEKRIAEVLPCQTSQQNDIASRPVFSALDCSKFQESFNCKINHWKKNLSDYIGIKY